MDNPSNSPTTDSSLDNSSDSSFDNSHATVQWQLNALTEALGELTLSVVDSLSIGRGSDNDVVLGSKQVSRNHALLSVLNGKLYLKDLASSNGTFVNDEQVEANKSKLLNADDKVSFAAFSFAVVERHAAASGTDTAPVIAADMTSSAQETVDATELPIAPNTGNIPAQDAVAKLNSDQMNNTVVDSSVTDSGNTSATTPPDPHSEPEVLESVLPPVPLEALSSVNVDSISDNNGDGQESSSDSAETVIQQPLQPLQANLEVSSSSSEDEVSLAPVETTESAPVLATEKVEEAVVIETDEAPETVVSEPVIDETVVEQPVIDKPVVSEEVIDEAVIVEPIINKPIINKPIINELEPIDTPETEVVQPIPSAPMPVLAESLAPQVTPATEAEPTVELIAEVAPEKVKVSEPLKPEPIAPESTVSEPVKAEPIVSEPILQPEPILTPSEPLKETTMSIKDPSTNDSSIKDPHDKTTTTELQQEADPDVLRAKQAATGQFSGTANLGTAKDLGTEGNNAMDQALNNPATHSDIHKKPSGGWFIWLFIGLIILGIALWMFNMGGVGG